MHRFTRNYCNFAYSALACFKMRMSELASFQRSRKARVVGSSFATAVTYECRSHDSLFSGTLSPGVTIVTG